MRVVWEFCRMGKDACALSVNRRTHSMQKHGVFTRSHGRNRLGTNVVFRAWELPCMDFKLG